jgi:hypothetical protein
MDGQAGHTNCIGQILLGKVILFKSEPFEMIA